MFSVTNSLVSPTKSKTKHLTVKKSFVTYQEHQVKVNATSIDNKPNSQGKMVFRSTNESANKLQCFFISRITEAMQCC